MTVRSPMTFDDDSSGGGTFRELTATEMDNLHEYIAKLYGDAPSSTLTVDIGNGNIGVFVDKNLTAGTATEEASTYATEANTPDTVLVTTELDNAILSYTYDNEDTDVYPENSDNIAYPLYWDDANLTFQSMTKDDFYDTFIYPAIGKITNSTTIYDGTYIVSTETALDGYNQEGTLALDRLANISAYTAGGIPETVAQFNSTQYRLHKKLSPGKEFITHDAFSTYNNILFIKNNGGGSFGIDGKSESDLEDTFYNAIRWAACGLVNSNYAIAYAVIPSTSLVIDNYNLKPGAMYNSFYTEQTFARRYVGVDDYRTQKFPSGTPTIETYYLAIGRT